MARILDGSPERTRRYHRRVKLYNLWHTPPRAGVWRTRVPEKLLSRLAANYRAKFGRSPEVEKIQ